MKNIIAITLTVTVLMFIGFLMSMFRSQDTNIGSHLPMSFSTEGRKLAIFQKGIEPEQKTVQLGYPDEISFQVLSTTGNYIDQDNKLALTIWVEEVDRDSFELYKQKAWERYQAGERASTSEKMTLQNHEVYLSFRNIKENVDDTSKMITMGGGYIFYPEKNMIITYTIYNPRLYACEDLQKPETCMYDKNVLLPLKESNKKIAEQILSFVTL